MRGLPFLLVVRLVAAALLACVHCAAGAGTQAPAATQPASAAAPAVLPRDLPVRRGLGMGPEPAGWGSPLLALALTGAAGAGLLWWRTAHARKGHAARARSGPAAVSRLASQALTAHASVHAVQWNGEELLVGCTAQQVTILSRRRIGGTPGDAS